MADANTGGNGTIRIDANRAGSNAAGNYSDVSWAFYLIERVSAPSTWTDTPTLADVLVNGVQQWQGSFVFDWRSGGLQSQLLAAGATRVYHNPDGSAGDAQVRGSIGNTGTSGAGGPTAVIQGVPLPTLKVVPGTPTSVSAVRNSDTQATVSWSQSSASNGQPTSNTVRARVNDGAWADVVTISPATSTTITIAPNQKIEFAVKATNSAGVSSWSSTSAAIYTTPAAPTGVSASKVGSDIQVAWTPNVAFAEHQHVIEHGVDVAGVVTWDGSPLATVAGGTSTYTHVAPNASQRHVYRVRARNTDVAALSSATVTSNVVQLLTAPNAPTIPALAAFADRAAALTIPWTHNPVDTTPQTAYEFGVSTNGGSSWSSSGKVTSATSSRTIAGGTYAANVALTVRVRTWGSATSGGSGGTGASPWSSLQTLTFKSRPVASIISPAASSVQTQAALAVQLGFSQAEAATFVSATIGLYQGATLLEEKVSTTLSSTAFSTRLADGGSYSVRATVKDSNGLTSAQVTNAFTVDYTEPVAAVVALTYLRDSGIMQVALTIPAAGGGLVAATAVTVERVIDGVLEVVVFEYAAAPSLTILDMTPTINGTNLYRVTTRSVDGATTVVEASLATSELEWAFISKGPGFDQIIRFGGKLSPTATPTVDAALVKAAGRARPIGLYAATGSLVVTGVADFAPGYGSTPEEIEALLLRPTKACYRDPSGRRMFGLLTGSIAREDIEGGQFSYSVTETD